MKIIDCEQGSDEWIAARLGIPTASEFGRIITAAEGRLSKSARKYAQGLVAETLLGRPLEKSSGTTWQMERGKALEPFAIAQYAQENKVEVRRVGLVTTDCGQIGASPDGLIVGTRGGLEVKCTTDEVHMGILFDGPGDDYKQQVQGNLAVSELLWWDLYAYHPILPSKIFRTYRIEPYITKMQAALGEFLDLRDALLAQAKASGWVAREAAQQPATFGAIKHAA